MIFTKLKVVMCKKLSWCMQGYGVGPGGVAWPRWAQCVSEPWAHAWMYKITSKLVCTDPNHILE